jgi:hypothetical protein
MEGIATNNQRPPGVDWPTADRRPPMGVVEKPAADGGDLPRQRRILERRPAAALGLAQGSQGLALDGKPLVQSRQRDLRPRVDDIQRAPG